MIKEYLGNGSKYNCSITYVNQEKLDGNAGALYGMDSVFSLPFSFLANMPNLARSRAIPSIRASERDDALMALLPTLTFPSPSK